MAYASKLGLRLTVPAYADKAAVTAFRSAIVEKLESTHGPAQPITKGRWPIRYAARRTAWHTLDHAWEIEDRTQPAP